MVWYLVVLLHITESTLACWAGWDLTQGSKRFLNCWLGRRWSQSWSARASTALVHPGNCRGSCCLLPWPSGPRLTDVSQRSGCFSQPCGRMSPMEPTDPTAANVTVTCVPAVLTRLLKLPASRPQWSDDIWELSCKGVWQAWFSALLEAEEGRAGAEGASLPPVTVHPGVYVVGAVRS